MRLNKRITTLTILVLLGLPLLANAQEPAFFLVPEGYATARVEAVSGGGEERDVRLKITNGDEKGKIIQVRQGDVVSLREDQYAVEGEDVVITRASNGETSEYEILDKYRLPGVLLIALLFFAAVIGFGRKRGVTSLAGLTFTIVILIFGIIPGIVAGWNPFLVSLAGAMLIAMISLYLSHGFSRRTTIALISTIITLFISAVLSIIFVELTKLSGSGSEEAFFLQLGAGTINLKGLLLGGIIIGALGVLDDITTAQTAAVEEIHNADKKVSLKELYLRGISVGKEHIASLVNTLVLAYAGASFPLLILFTMDNIEPLWVTLNHEFMVEEIVRTLVGSTALIFAVPITTWLAARAFTKPQTVKHHA